jgi:DNA-binding beta-propeller fold protein YncE
VDTDFMTEGYFMHASFKVLGLALVMSAGAGCAEDDACSTPGTACTYAGIGERGFNIENPTADKLDSKLYYPSDLTFGPDGRAYIVDWNNHRIRRVESDNSLHVVVGTDYEGDGPPEMEDRLPVCNPAGAPGTTVAMNHMTDAKFGPDGLLYIAAWHNNKIRVYDPATELVTSIAGDGYGFVGDGGPACNALFNTPKTVAIANDGTIYAIDQKNVRIRAIAPDATRTITTIAGDGIEGNIGDGGQALDAQFGFEIGTTPRPSGALLLDGRTMYVADSMNNRIRRINLDTGIVDCIAGKTDAGYSGDGGPALDATFNFPVDLELGPDGRLYVADRGNHAVRAIDLTTGIVETVVGDGTQCDLAEGACPDHRLATQVQLNQPYGIAFDPAGNLYVADTHNNRILKVTK